MADEKPNPAPESEDESFWNLDAQGVDDILSEAAEPESPQTQSAKPEESPAPSEEDTQPSQEPVVPAYEAKPQKEKVSSGERIAQLSVFAVLIGVAVWLCIYLTNMFDTSEHRDYVANTPASGEYASIEKIDSWWQEPNATTTQLGTKIVPVAEIFLDPSTSKSGYLRVVFFSMEENTDGSAKSAGDSITLKFENGKFENGQSSMIVVGTDGMAEMGDFYAYRNQDEERWTVEVRESSGNSSDTADYKMLAKAPIDPTIKVEE